jgi:transposase
MSGRIPNSRRSEKKRLPDAVRQVQTDHPQASVEIWAMDEQRIGLKPVLRRVWTRQGQRRRITVRHRYQWMYVYGFVCPESGQTEWRLFSTVRTDMFSQVLADFAQAVGAGPTKQIVLVLDGTGWHASKQLTIPAGVQLVFLPPYSPERQPAERFWTLTHAAIVNRLFATLDELEEAQGQRCVSLQANPDLIRRHTLFAWWPRLHPH